MTKKPEGYIWCDECWRFEPSGKVDNKRPRNEWDESERRGNSPVRVDLWAFDRKSERWEPIGWLAISYGLRAHIERHLQAFPREGKNA